MDFQDTQAVERVRAIVGRSERSWRHPSRPAAGESLRTGSEGCRPPAGSPLRNHCFGASDFMESKMFGAG